MSTNHCVSNVNVKRNAQPYSCTHPCGKDQQIIPSLKFDKKGDLCKSELALAQVAGLMPGMLPKLLIADAGNVAGTVCQVDAITVTSCMVRFHADGDFENATPIQVQVKKLMP